MVTAGDMAICIETRDGRRNALRVEVAATLERRMRGLMDRDTLAADAGMLFLYAVPQPGDAGFWMYRTRLPLDIAFLDADGRVRAVRTMPPCPSHVSYRCPAYQPDVPYSAALEVNAGYLANRGIGPGARVMFQPCKEEDA